FILFFIYDWIFFAALLVYLPVYASRKKITLKALREKFGLILIPKQSANCIWIQVVSVGEVILIEALIKRLREIFDCPIVISTTTLTGNKVAKEKYSSLAHIIFFPFDFSLVVTHLIRILRPKLFIAVETEIWPNLFYNLKKNNIPVLIVNGRISDKAYRRYRLIKPIIAKVLKCVSCVGAQSGFYKERFLALGCRKEKLVISGNLKFEGVSPDSDKLSLVKAKYAPILKRENHLLLIAASTHAPEEEVILDIFSKLSDFTQNVSLLIAPRHIDRTKAIENIIHEKGFPSARISTLSSSGAQTSSNTVYILDVIGELLYFYSIADICFVGGSLARYGGHNILEPIYFSKPTIFGPFMDNFRDIEEAVLKRGAGIKANDANELKEILLRLINDNTLRDNLALRSLRIFSEERQGLEKNIEMIMRSLQKRTSKSGESGNTCTV
ncbi:MAG: 3-deoxy-D-manno-octulosonic acid transferase, partial [Candidatus Omnitrophica bacterium]|nr:3-deoxy-D-manno-octulosonic acid transferase [Candidatus Omnitrophota bacterium]